MDLTYGKEDEAFRRELRAWLRKHLPKRGGDADGNEDMSYNDPRRIAAAKAWQRTLYKAGYVAIGWPKEFGGQGASVVRQTILSEELILNRAPSLIGMMGVQMVGPTLIRHGTDEQRRAHLTRILAADEIWCQGYSEPGITVRPLVQMTGEPGFNEVFFSDVRVPRTNLVGTLHEGWQVANSTLQFERNMLASTTRTQQLMGDLVALAQRRTRNGGKASRDPWVRQRLADLQIRTEAMKYHALKQLSDGIHGRSPGIGASINKLVTTELNHDICAAALEVLGSYGQLAKGAPHVENRGAWPKDHMFTLGMIIGGGTSQIQKNIISERGLGLPKGA